MNSIAIKDNKKTKFEDHVVDFLNPDYVYIPIYEDMELAVKTNALITKEQILLKNGNNYIYSPISGKVLGGTDSLRCNDVPQKCIVIENDFKESIKNKKGIKKYIDNYSRDEFIELINKYNAFKSPIPNHINNFIINGIDQDPFERTSSYIINNFSFQILEAIDAISDILGVGNTILAISNKDTKNVINLTNNIGTYPNIKLKLIPDVYPNGLKSVLLKNLLGKKQSDFLYTSVQDVYTIYNVLKRNKPITEKLVTIAGNAIKNPFVINVKIGTSIADIVKNCCEIVANDYKVVVNGLIAGDTYSTLNNVVTENTLSIFLNTPDNVSAKKCINCGLCNQKCPVGLNPKYIYEHKSADKSKCIHCGLCTYICPSKINFKKSLGD